MFYKYFVLDISRPKIVLRFVSAASQRQCVTSGT